MIDSQVRRDRLEDWVRYGKSSGKDTRLALCLPAQIAVTLDEETFLRAKGVGLYAVSTDRTLAERIPPADLGFNVALPELRSLPIRVRQLLGTAYVKFDRSDWRSGFEEACQTLEVEARKYLKKWTRTKRIRVVRRNGPVLLTSHQINRMTLGALAETFSKIQAKTQTDSILERALIAINLDRVGVAHHKSKATTEKRLRVNVGRHMWTIVGALKVL